MKHVLQGEGDHWFWNDARRNHRHNRRGHALFTWKVPPARRTRYKTRGEYCVARVFIEAQSGHIPPRTVVTNLCRLPQCVNPRHWQVQLQPPLHRLALLPDGTWQLLLHRTGQPCTDVTVVQVYDGQLVHLVRALPLSQRLHTPALQALCGCILKPSVARVVDSAVTCKGGC